MEDKNKNKKQNTDQVNAMDRRRLLFNGRLMKGIALGTSWCDIQPEAKHRGTGTASLTQAAISA